jgi:hypothetical protein
MLSRSVSQTSNSPRPVGSVDDVNSISLARFPHIGFPPWLCKREVQRWFTLATLELLRRSLILRDLMARLRYNSKTVICFWLTFRLRERHWFQARKGRLEPCPLSGSAAKFLTAGIETGSWRIDMFVVVPEGFSAFRRSKGEDTKLS